MLFVLSHFSTLWLSISCEFRRLNEPNHLPSLVSVYNVRPSRHTKYGLVGPRPLDFWTSVTDGWSPSCLGHTGLGTLARPVAGRPRVTGTDHASHFPGVLCLAHLTSTPERLVPSVTDVFPVDRHLWKAEVRLRGDRPDRSDTRVDFTCRRLFLPAKVLMVPPKDGLSRRLPFIHSERNILQN